MKKAVISVTIVFMLLIANVVYADYGIPGGVEYEAVVTNGDGAEVDNTYSSSLKVIPYGATVTVLYEYDGKAYIEYNDSSYDIDLDDIKPISDSDDLLENLDTNQKDMYVWREGAYLYNGPSILYGKLDEEIQIPVGTVVTIENCSEVWGYVEYDGYGGWIYIYTSDEVSPYDMDCSLTEIAYEKTSHYYTIDEISLSTTLDGEEVVGTIPAGVHIDSYFYSEYPDPHGKAIYVKYEDIEGWYSVDEEEVYQDYSVVDVQAFVSNDVEIYEELDLDDISTAQGTGTVLATIPKASFCDVLYVTCGNYESAICVEYEGVQGWTYGYYVNIDTSIWNSQALELESDAEIIDFETGEKIGETIENGTIVIEKYSYYDSDSKKTYYYVETFDEEISGWTTDIKFSWVWDEDYDIDYLREQYVDITQFVKEEYLSSEEVNIDDENEENTGNEVAEDKEKKESKIDSVFESYLIYCVIGAVVAVVVAVLLLVIVNKCSNKKKNKKEE